MKINKTIPILITLCASIWFVATPFIVIQSMHLAIQSKNAESLSTFIDYKSVKDNLKDSIHEQIATELLNADQSDLVTEKTAATFTTNLIDPIIESMITPENMANLITGNADYDKRIDMHTSTTKKFYTNFNIFVVSVENQKTPEKPILLIFKRHNLFSWRLVKLQLNM